MISLRGLEPSVRAAAENALAWANYYRIPVRVVSGLRSHEQQARLRAAFLSGRSTIPAAAAGNSAHEFGLAFDSVAGEADVPDWTIIREWIGFCVPSNDVNHAEVCGWRRFVDR